MTDPQRLRAWIHRLLDGGLDDAGKRSLEAALASEGEARRIYVEELKLHASLVVNLGGVGKVAFGDDEMIRLTMTEPGAEPKTLSFGEPAVIIGRSNDCTLPIGDTKASRMHCQIVHTGQGFELVDLGSSNGTLVNGRECKRQVLQPGDEVHIGHTVIRFLGSGNEPAASAALDETPADGVPAAPAAPARPVLRPAVPLRPGPQPRVSSVRAATAPKSFVSHLLPMATFVAILGVFGLILFFVVLKDREAAPTGSESLSSEKTKAEDEAWKEFERLDRERREEQKRREEAIIREAEEKRLRQQEEATKYASEVEAQEAAKRAEEARKKAEIEAAEAAKRQAEAEERRKRREAEAEIFYAEKARFEALEPDVTALVKKFRFDVALERLREYQTGAKTEAGVELAVLRIDEINTMSAAFTKMWQSLKEGAEVTVRDRTVKVRSADADGFTGHIGTVATTQKWATLPPEDLEPLLEWPDQTAEEYYGAGLLCFALALHEDGEALLARCVAKEPARKTFLDLVVARARGMEVPPGGFLVHMDQWVTAEEKAFLDQGRRRYNGQWLTEDEINKAKGLVKVGDTWMTPAEAEAKQRQDNEVNKFKPKGYIDKPGYYEGKPWDEAITFETANYKITSNLKPEAIKDAAYIMEWMNWNFRKIFHFSKRMQKFEVWIGGSHQDYMAHGGGHGQALGHCTSGGVISTFYQPPITTLVLMHEGTHQFLFRIAPTAPLWIHEGMATFFECSKFDVDMRKKELVLRTGLLNRNRLMAIQRSLKNGSAASMDDFVNGRKGDPYSQGWSFVYFVVNYQKGRYAYRWLDFIKDVGKGNPMKWFKKWMGVTDLDAFETEWKAFIEALDPMKGEDQNLGHK